MNNFEIVCALFSPCFFFNLFSGDVTAAAIRLEIKNSEFKVKVYNFKGRVYVCSPLVQVLNTVTEQIRD